MTTPLVSTECAEDAAGKCKGLFLCDIPPLTDTEIRQVFGHYGEIVSLTRVNEAVEEAVSIEFSTWEEAEEAQSIVNHAAIKGKTCRCIFAKTLEELLQSMDGGQRLVIENLDGAIESRGLRDVCALFGQVLDAKVELDENEKSRGFGFVHFASQEEAAKATSIMHKMQIGTSIVEVRPFERKDVNVFTGCLYGQEQLDPDFGGNVKTREALGLNRLEGDVDVPQMDGAYLMGMGGMNCGMDMMASDYGLQNLEEQDWVGTDW